MIDEFNLSLKYGHGFDHGLRARGNRIGCSEIVLDNPLDRIVLLPWNSHPGSRKIRRYGEHEGPFTCNLPSPTSGLSNTRLYRLSRLFRHKLEEDSSHSEDLEHRDREAIDDNGNRFLIG